MIKEKVLGEFNNQINEELYSAYLYLSMGAWFEAKNLSGFAGWMKAQAAEEVKHAMKFFGHIVERGGKVELGAIKEPKKEWKNALDAFEEAYKHEQHVTGRIHMLVDLAQSENDKASESFLGWFVDEQVEEEASTDKVVQQLTMIKDHPGALFMLNKVMGERKD